jgi:osmoprotectant transport system substrate-binding protein
VIGTKNFTEQFILGELYAQALEARGYEVRLRRDIGSTEVIDTAFVGGEIDMYPEYTGVIVAVLAGSGPEPRSEGEAYEQAKAFLETRGATLLEPTPFSDQDAIATREDFAAEHDLRSIPDLARLPSVTIGGRPEFRTRRQGLRGLQDVYGLRNLRFTEVAGERTYEALDAGDVQAASALTTDAALASERYRLLEDPKKLFGFQNAAPVIRRDKLETLGEDFEAIVNRVSGALTDDAMVAMNAAVDIEQQDPATVAEAFLEANDLLG